MDSCYPLSEANSSPTYRWTKPFTRLRKENSFGKFVKYFKIFVPKRSLFLSYSSNFIHFYDYFLFFE
ncbi:hypothetical protein COE09_03575 [Bacillus thuringiensis]|nr:hypothetical protein COE09_03575 [Bacillus thuringiensis]